jgi:hypothetical protein
MATIPWLPTYLIRHGATPLRKVYVSRTIEHARLLQQRNPLELVALPPRALWEEVSYIQGWWYPQLCANLSILTPIRAMDIVHHTPCRKLLIGNILMEFNETHTSHERVLTVDPGALY